MSIVTYHESVDLIPQVEAYKELHGHYPGLGRPKTKTKQTYYQKRKARKEAAERNQIEGKFGQGKNGYNLNEIRARLKETSES